ncbi:MAG: ABC transporter ATP-binding protein, partial [Acidimicrobiales bacterium]
MTSTSEKRGSELTLESITKSFGGPPAVREVSLAVEPHEFLTLLGPSGSGKTTILRMIGGFIAPDSGRILIDGTDVSGVPVERRPTAMLFQQLSLWPHLSAARNVSFGLELRRRPKAEIRRRVDELLSVVGLADFGDRLPNELSGGQQQRVALARALALEPRILLLDEPFSALDTNLRVELRTFVRNLQREVGTTTLLVTHDHEEALELSDRIVVLNDGHIEQIGDPTEIYDTPATVFVADFLGAMNFLAGAHAAHEVRLPGDVAVHVEQDAS